MPTIDSIVASLTAATSRMANAELRLFIAECIKNCSTVEQQLDCIRDILAVGALMSESFAVVVFESWTILTRDNVWKVGL